MSFSNAESVDTLKRSLAAGKGEFDTFDLFFLAMAHRKLGHIGQAHAGFEAEIRWRREHTNLSRQWNAELDAFQAEAQAVLDGPTLDLPDDVFADNQSEGR